jgi:acetyl esterase/lipase
MEVKMIQQNRRPGYFSLWKVPLLVVLTLAGEFRASKAVMAEDIGYSKQTYTHKVVGDCQIQADVYRLPDRVVRPAILYIHGGALIIGNRRINAQQLNRYVKAGYVLVSIDYRLAPETKLDGIIGDIQDAYAWVRNRGPNLFQIDPDRIAVLGGSAGGYLTLMTGFCVNPRPRALVSFYGYGDITGTWLTRPDLFYNRQPAVPKEEAYRVVGGPVISGDREGDNRARFYIYCRQQGLWPKEIAGHDPDKEPHAFDKFCPVRNVDRNYPPTMLLHGDKDTDVPFGQSVSMDKELERRGVEHEFIVVPNGGHGFDFAGKGMDDPDTARIYGCVIDFLDKHVK